MDPTVYNPTIPFVGNLPGSFRSGNLIRISGTVADSATCFSINLQNGSNSAQRSDIALHLSPVFSPPPRIVRNSLENQQWGPEESHGPHFPLSAGQGFEILILAESDHFKIAVNGQHFTEFQHRLPLQSISNLSVDGDVIINSIKLEGFTQSPMNQGAGEEITKPLGFLIDTGNQSNIPPRPPGRPSSPYDMSSLPYPSNPSFGPSPTPYSPQSPSSPYASGLGSPYPPPAGYGPPPQGSAYPSGRVSPYAPNAPGGNPYGPSAGAYPQGSYPSPQGGYPAQTGGYPAQMSGYPSQTGGYPSQPGGYPAQGAMYPGQQGGYPGQQVVYPDQEKNKSSSGMNFGPLAAAGAAALTGIAGSALIGGKHKKKKHGYGVPGMGHGVPGMGAGSGILGGVTSLLGGGGHKKHSGSSSIPIGGAMAGGAAALAGTYMMGKMMKPKKLKKLYKHKHKGGWGGRSSSSSSSSSD